MKTKAKNKYKVQHASTRQLKRLAPPQSRLEAAPISQFEDAVRRRDLQSLVWMIDSGTIHVDQETVAGETSLLAAVAANNVLAMELLFSRYTVAPFVLAVLVQCLRDCSGANPNAVNRHGYTPLMKAATIVGAVDCSEAVLALLRHRADVFARDRTGKTALEWARLTNNITVCRHLELAIQTHIYARRCAEADETRAHTFADVLERHTKLCVAMQAAVAASDFAQVRDILFAWDYFHALGPGPEPCQHERRQRGSIPRGGRPRRALLPRMVYYVAMRSDQGGMDAIAYAAREGHNSTVAILERAKAGAMDHLDHTERLKAKTSDVPCKLNCGFCHAKDLIRYHEENKSVSTSAALTLNGVQLRIRRLERFLATELDATVPALAAPFLRQWITGRVHAMAEALATLHMDSTQLGLVMRYDPTTQCHSVSIDGVGAWIHLSHTYFAEDPSEHDWKCGWLAAHQRQEHQESSCPHKIVPCPLGCGQQCQQFQLMSHTKDRCIKRTLACRLGCGRSMSVEGLLAHEESECPLRYVLLPHPTLAVRSHSYEFAAVVTNSVRTAVKVC
ncbi:hypothetical protein DYB32_007602 [Aphanomyces invadans]|uniref:TRAF-type domain-containing protein n=1 Tax=Aphanomyces invadans TaxID=157072 RepID=A0A418AND1_9STRA|nr:hypothetical protein DYB32_007602 [Aphanomyces invadans]